MGYITRSRAVIGSYKTTGDARVLVVDRSESDKTFFNPIVSAHCGGHGCVAEAPVEHGGSLYRSMVNPQEKVARLALKIQEWAQQHAEVCRATPAPGKHPGELDLPLCGHADPEPQPNGDQLTCQLTASHAWQHAAYTGGSYGYRHQWKHQDA